MTMTIAKAIEALEVSAEVGDCDSEAVRTVRDALTLTETRAERRAWRSKVLDRMRVMRVSPTDVLVWRLPDEVINDADEMRKVRVIASEFANIAQRGVLILAEDTDLTAQPVATVYPAPVIHPPPIIIPGHVHRS